MINDIKKFLLVFQLLCISGLAYASDQTPPIFSVSELSQAQDDTSNNNRIRAALEKNHIRADLENHCFADCSCLIIEYLGDAEHLFRINIGQAFTNSYVTTHNASHIDSTLKGLCVDPTTKEISAAYWVPQTTVFADLETDPVSWHINSFDANRVENGPIAKLFWQSRIRINQLDGNNFITGLQEADAASRAYRNKTFKDSQGNDMSLSQESIIVPFTSDFVPDHHFIAVYVRQTRNTHHTPTSSICYSLPLPEVYAIIPHLDRPDVDTSSPAARSLLAGLAATSQSSLKQQHASKLPALSSTATFKSLPAGPVAPLSNQQKSDKHVRNALLAVTALAPAFMMLKAASK